MKVDEVLKGLNEALRAQYRSVVQFTLAGGSIQGLEHLATSQVLWNYAVAELEDTRRLIEKIVALGGEPAVDVPTPPFSPDIGTFVDKLIANEQEALAALHAVIPATGQEPRSEALEHLLEHLILRKQSQVDTLLRAVGRTEGSRS